MVTTTLPLDRIRRETPGTQSVIHFNNAGSSLPPEPVLEVVLDHLRLEASIGGYEAVAAAYDRLEQVYESLAKLVNGRADQIGVIENATRAWDMVVYGYPFAAGDRVLTGRSEYMSNLIAFRQIQKRVPIEIVLIDDDEHGQIYLAELERELAGGGAAMVALTHIPTSGGLINPAAEVGALCRAHGVFYMLDACQSVGQVPIDVEAIGCDALATTGRKYLRGPRGTGFLWVGDNALEVVEPPLLDLHAATWVDDERYEIRPGARRFENWEGYVAGKLGLGAAADYLLDLGVEPTTSRVLELGAELRDRLGEVEGVHVRDKGASKGGIVTFTADGRSSAEVSTSLRDAGVNTSVSAGDRARVDLGARGIESVVRASVHYYNTSAEVDRFVAELRRI